MNLLSTAIVVAEGAAGEGGGAPAWATGLVAFGALVVALIVTMMINVNR